MSGHLTQIQQHIEKIIAHGSIIDVEFYCERLGFLCPSMPHKARQDAVLRAVVEKGGCAVWGHSLPALHWFWTATPGGTGQQGRMAGRSN